MRYSDSPCLGAKKLEVEPTRGLNKSSGKERIGQDVRREKEREMFADAVRPLTGMDAKQLDRAGRRLKLSPEVQRECRRLDYDVPAAEQVEREATAQVDVKAAQERVFKLRAAYRKLGCA